jgi:hypothetical protein
MMNRSISHMSFEEGLRIYGMDMVVGHILFRE